MFKTKIFNLVILLLFVLLVVEISVHVQGNDIQEIKSRESPKEGRAIGRLSDFFSSISRASSRSFSLVSNFLVSHLPSKKILITSGALMSLFFIFVRLIIVMAPILLLGALTRESTDASDILQMLFDFYNQIIVALEDNEKNSG